MEEISQDELEKSQEEFKKILDEGGKIIRTIIEEKDKTTIILKEEPVKGKATSSTIIQTKDDMQVNFS